MLIDLLTSDESHLVEELVWALENAVLPETLRKSIENCAINSLDEVFITCKHSRKMLVCLDV
jgi:hypothetical protein